MTATSTTRASTTAATTSARRDRRWWSGCRAGAANEAEVAAPLTIANGRRVVGASFEGEFAAPMMKSFTTATDREIDTVGLDRKNSRRLDTFLGEGFLGRR